MGERCSRLNQDLNNENLLNTGGVGVSNKSAEGGVGGWKEFHKLMSVGGHILGT